MCSAFSSSCPLPSLTFRSSSCPVTHAPTRSAGMGHLSARDSNSSPPIPDPAFSGHGLSILFYGRARYSSGIICFMGLSRHECFTICLFRVFCYCIVTWKRPSPPPPPPPPPLTRNPHPQPRLTLPSSYSLTYYFFPLYFSVQHVCFCLPVFLCVYVSIYIFLTFFFLFLFGSKCVCLSV